MITVEAKTDQVLKELKRFAGDQLPFAASYAVNKISWDARDQALDKIDNHLTLRTSWMKKKGALPVIKSHKRQWPDIFAVLGVKDAIAAKAVTGGKRPNASGKMAVPLSSGADQSTRQRLNPSRETLGPSRFPNRLTKRRRQGKSKAFFTKIKRGSLAGQTVLARRTSKNRTPLEILYVFKSNVEIKRQWPLDDHVEQFVRINYAQYFLRALDLATG